jgi:phage-related protein
VADKALVWVGSSRRDVRAFPAQARRLVGFELRRVQQGLDPDDWKPMTTVGTGVREIRIYVLHAFEKKTRKTSAADLKIGRDRFRALGS